MSEPDLLLAAAPATPRQPYPGLTPDEAKTPFKTAVVVNNLLRGRLNAVIDVDVTGLTSPVTVKDDRITSQSWVQPMNMDAYPTFAVLDLRQGEIDVRWAGSGSVTPVICRLLVIG